MASRLLVVGAGTAIVSAVVNVLIATVLASVLQVSSAFPPLRAANVATFTVVGVAGATVVFGLLARFRPDPLPTFRVVAAVVLVVSWAAPLLAWATSAFPGSSGAAALSLMVLHAVAAGLSVLLLGRFGLAAARQAA